MADKKATRPPSSHSSGEHRLYLTAALEDPENAKILEEAKREIGSERPPPDLDSLAKEVDDASTTLTESVDQIVGVLLLVLGKQTKIVTAQEKTLRASRVSLIWIRVATVVSAFAFVALGVLLYRVDQTARSLNETQRGLTSTVEALNKTIEALERTDEKVEAVKKQTEEAPRVEIVPDEEDPESGSAVVRITPPKKQDQKPTPEPSATVEIPIDLKGAKVLPRDGGPELPAEKRR